MNCQNCGAPMKLHIEKRQFVCSHCGSSYFPKENEEQVQVLGDLSHALCPCCNHARLVFAAVAEKTVLYCKECRGLLFQLPEFLPILNVLRAARPAGVEVIPPLPNHEEKNRRIACPVCKTEMNNYMYGDGGNVYVDSCIDCGVLWLDYRELSRIVNAPMRKRHQEQSIYWKQVNASYTEDWKAWDEMYQEGNLLANMLASFFVWD